MKQQTFEAARAERWDQFEAALAALDRRASDPTGEFPKLYRELCQDLALARDRRFTGALIDRLNLLALRGHHHLYRGQGPVGAGIVRFVARDFPRAVRAEARLFWLMSFLFYGPLALMAWLAAVGEPTVIYSLLEPHRVREFEQMYREQLDRTYTDNLAMFGFYIFNNVGIAFRSFASGLLLGIGSLFVTIFNGLYIGLIFGRILGLGEPYSTKFLGFVSGHSSFELTAIVIASTAGMRLGLSVLAPGQRSRGNALRTSARDTLPLVYGAGGMLVIAALIEAFWSATSFVESGHDPVRYAVGGVLWTAVALYLLLAGRSRAV